MSTRAYPFTVKGGGFKLKVSGHAAERMDERAGWNFAERKVAAERVAEQCASRYVRPRDTFDIIEDGMRWSIAMAGKRKGVVTTVIPERWVKEDYSMRDWL